MKPEIELLNRKFEQLVSSPFVSFAEVASLKNTMGVYVIYDHNEKILYIGNTNKFHVRFGTDLKHETTHTLTRKLLKSGEYSDRKQTVEYLKDKCKMKIEVCASKREAEALEGVAIYVLKPRLNK